MTKNMPQRGSLEEYKKDDRVLPRKIEVKKGFFYLVKKGVALILTTAIFSSSAVVFVYQTALSINKKVEKNYMTEEIDSYWSIVKKLYLLIENEYNPQTPYEWFAIMKALYNKGIFAPSTYYSSNNNEIICELGMTTFTNNGVCRHINEFFTDVLKFAGYDAILVANYLRFDSETGAKSMVEDVFGNHVYTMLESDREAVIFDYMNNLIFHKIDGNWEEILKKASQTELKPIGDLIRYSDYLKTFENILFRSESMTREKSNKIFDEYKKYYATVCSKVEEIMPSNNFPFWLAVRNSIIKDIDLINIGLENMPTFLR